MENHQKEEELIFLFEKLKQNQKENFIKLLMESISKDKEKLFHSKNILEVSKKILSPNVFEIVPLELKYEILSYIGDLEELTLTNSLVSKEFHQLTNNFILEQKFGKDFSKEFNFQQLLSIYQYYSSLISFNFIFSSQEETKKISFVTSKPCPVKSTIIGFNMVTVSNTKGFTIQIWRLVNQKKSSFRLIQEITLKDSKIGRIQYMLDKDDFIEIEKSDYIGWRFESTAILPFQPYRGFVRFSKNPIESPKINDVISFVSHDTRHYPISPIFHYEENFKNTLTVKQKLRELHSRQYLDDVNFLNFLVNIPLEKDGILRECCFFSQININFVVGTWRNSGNNKFQLINQKELMSGENGIQKRSLYFKVKKGDYFGFRFLSRSCISHDDGEDFYGVYWSRYAQKRNLEIGEFFDFKKFGNRKYSIEVFY
jgi:hypothetical protein